jgi:hypothetical protein
MVEEMNQLRCLLIELFDILLHIVLAVLALVATLLTLVLLGIATLLINFWVILDHILGSYPVFAASAFLGRYICRGRIVVSRRLRFGKVVTRAQMTTVVAEDATLGAYISTSGIDPWRVAVQHYASGHGLRDLFAVTLRVRVTY